MKWSKSTAVNLTEKISVVMITHNRKETVLSTLETLRETFPEVKVVVVDNASTDGTEKAVAVRFPEASLVCLPENRGALARNVGVSRTSTPYVAFCDDDSWWEREALFRAIEYFELYDEVGLIAGRILVNEEESLDATSALQAVSPLEPWVDMPGPAILGFLGCGIIVRRLAFIDAGGYNPYIYFSGEEELLAMDMASAGWGMTYCADVIGHHYPAKSRQMGVRYRWGARNRVMAAWMRRPLGKALVKTRVEWRKAWGNWQEMVGVIQGVLWLPRSLWVRQPIPDWLEKSIEVLENQNEQLAGKASRLQQRSGHKLAPRLRYE